MSWLDKAKIAADIAKITSEIWGIIRDKNKQAADKDAKIKSLEAEIAELKKKDKDQR